MQRKHSSTGYSPNELVYAKPVKLPPPVGDLEWRSVWKLLNASATLSTKRAEADAWKSSQREAHTTLVHHACDRILAAQQRHVAQQTSRLQSSASNKGGERSAAW